MTRRAAAGYCKHHSERDPADKAAAQANAAVAATSAAAAAAAAAAAPARPRSTADNVHDETSTAVKRTFHTTTTWDAEGFKGNDYLGGCAERAQEHVRRLPR